MGRVLHRRLFDRYWPAATTWTRVGQCPMAAYPKIFNIEADPHEDLNVFGLFPFASEAALNVVEKYLASVKISQSAAAERYTISQH